MKRHLILLLIGLIFILFNPIKAQIHTQIVASSIEKDIAVTNAPINFQFLLNTIPADAEKIECTLNFAFAKCKIISSADIFITCEDKQVSSMTLEDSVSSFNSESFALKTNNLVNLVVKVEAISGNEITIQGSSADKMRPYLQVTYTRPYAPITDWAGSAANAQHTSCLPYTFRGSAISSIISRPVKDLKNIDNQSLAYKNKLYIFASEASNTSLYEISKVDKVTKLKEKVSISKSSIPVINQEGYLYYYSNENNISIINLNNPQEEIPAISILRFGNNQPIINTPLMLGSDGSLYVVTNEGLFVYSSFPQHQLLWKKALSEIKSGVSLNAAGTKLYCVRPNQVVEINTATQTSEIIDSNPNSSGKYVPIITPNSDIYLNSQKNGMRKVGETSEVTNVANPADNGGYFIYASNNQLYKEKDGEQKSIQINNPYAILTDLSQNIYCVGASGSLNVFNQGNEPAISSTQSLNGDAAFQYSPILTANGNLYAVTSSTLYKYIPQFKDDYNAKGEDLEVNNSVLRAKTLTIPIDAKLAYNQYFIATNAIKMADNIVVEKTANVTMEIGQGTNGGISFGKNFSVKKGATLSCSTGN